MLRAICRAIVVLPVPWAPPMSISSPGAQAAAEHLIERREAERHRLVLGELAGRDLRRDVDEHLDRRARRHAPVRAVEPPRASSVPDSVSGRHLRSSLVATGCRGAS